MKEEWKLIPYNFYYSNNKPNTKYYVSNKGRVKNIKTGRILSKVKTYSGRYRVSLYDNNTSYNKLIHVMVAELFLPESPRKKNHIRHIDSDFTNNNASNLEWISFKEQLEDSKSRKSNVL